MKKNLSLLTLNITFVVLVSKVLALIREIVLAYAYGTSVTADAYTLVQSLVTTLEGIFMAATLAFMPVYQIYKLRNNTEKKEFLDSVYTILTVITCLAALLCLLSGDLIFKLLSPGLDKETYAISVNIFKILVFAIPTTFLVSMQGQHLRCESSLLLPAVVSIPAHILVIISFLYIAPISGINGVCICFVLGLVIQMILQHIALIKKLYHFKLCFAWRNKGVQQIILLTLPMTVSGSIENLTSLVSKIFASNLSVGAISTLNYANKLALMVISLLAAGPVTIYYTKMSELYAVKKHSDLTRYFVNCINITNMIIIPLSIGMITLRVPIIQLFFERGSFTTASSQITAGAFTGYILGLLGHSIRLISTRLYYSCNNQKIPLINGISIIIMCIIFSALFSNSLGILGLALAASLSTTLGGIILLLRLKEIEINIKHLDYIMPLILFITAGIIMGKVVSYCYHFFYQMIESLIYSLILSTLIGVTTYFGTLYFTRHLYKKIFISR